MRLAAVIADLYSRYGFRHGIMRGYWASRSPVQMIYLRQATVAREIPAYGGFYTGKCAVRRGLLSIPRLIAYFGPSRLRDDETRSHPVGSTES